VEPLLGTGDANTSTSCFVAEEFASKGTEVYAVSRLDPSGDFEYPPVCDILILGTTSNSAVE
jgi:hypothetical protein